MAGLNAAIHARLHGFEVMLLEQRSEAGGKAAGIEVEGFQLDPGPSILILTRLYEQVFRRAGRSMSEFLKFRRLEVLSRIQLEGQPPLNLPGERQACLDVLRAVAPQDVDSVQRLMDRLDGAAHLLDRSVFARPYLEQRDLLDPALMKFGLKMNPFRTYKAAVDQMFTSPMLRAFFYGFPSYGGQSYHAKGPAGFMIPYFMLADGVWVAEGGVRAIPKAFEKLARDLGVEFRFQAPVAQLWTEADRVRGVCIQAESGAMEKLDADAVICAVDPARLAPLPGQETWKPSYSYFTLHWGLRRTWPELEHHNLWIPQNFSHGFREIYDSRQFPSRPIVYLNATAAADPESAPPGCTNLFAVVTVPGDEPHLDYPNRRYEYRERVRHEVAQAGFEWSPGEEVFERLQDPPFFAERDGNHLGSLYGPDEKHRLWGLFPQSNRHHSLRGLYLAGGAVQPGAGLPMVTLSGQFAADLAARDAQRSQS